jgi:ABC-type transporter Mla subunit MlaD
MNTDRTNRRTIVSPTIVGAVTLLVGIVAVFLSYNANNGLPFVATYDINAQIPNADALVRGNEVRVGGVRVGRIDAVTPVTLESGEEVANVQMSLDKRVEPLSVDSTVLVRPRSPLALKYLEIKPGASEQHVEAGGTLSVTQAKVHPVDLDQFFNTFDDKTRTGIRGNLRGYGDALAGRGPDLNAALAALRPLLESAQPAARNLARKRTDFEGFWVALAATAGEVAPVAIQQAELFGGLDRTFAAFAEVADPYIAQTIERSPGTLAEANRSLPVVRPFLVHSSEFFEALQPGARALRRTSPVIASALVTGADVLPETPALNRQLAPTAQALVDFQEAPGVKSGLNGLIDTNRTLRPGIRQIAPAQTVCNYLTILFQNVARSGNDGNARGNFQYFFPITPALGANSEAGPAAAPAAGGETDRPPKLRPGPDRNYLHANPYPNTASPGQTRECEAGREAWLRGRKVTGNVSGNQGTKTRGQGKGGGG